MFSEFFWSVLFWLYIASTLAQLVFLWAVVGKLEIGNWKFLKRRRLISNFQFPIPNFQFPISILICARNEAPNLRRHLPEILAQQYPGEWELVVVDDASDDETPSVLKFFQEKNARLRVVRIAEKKYPGKKYALMQGIAAAKFDNLLFTDADCAPASVFWLSHMAAALSASPATEIALGYAPMRPGKGFLDGWVRFETAYTAMQYFSFAAAGMPYMGVGRNLAWKRQVFERTGGFSAHLDVPSGDDDLLVNAAAERHNVALCLQPDSFMYSEGAKTWGAWLRQKRRHLAAGKRYRPLHRCVLALLSLSHVLHYFLLAVLLFGGIGTVSVVLCFFARLFSLLYLCGKIFPRLREFRLLSRIPIYDLLLAAYFGVFVPIFLINNQHAHKWK